MLFVSSAGIAAIIVHLLRLAKDLAALELEIVEARPLFIWIRSFDDCANQDRPAAFHICWQKARLDDGVHVALDLLDVFARRSRDAMGDSTCCRADRSANGLSARAPSEQGRKTTSPTTPSSVPLVNHLC